MTRTAYKTQLAHISGPLVPPGWKLVPDHPTEEWIETMKQHTSYPQTARAIELMLSTAPKYADRK